MLSSRRFLKRFLDAGIGFVGHDGGLMAAAIAYYLALSFFPLLLVLVAVLGYATTGTVAGASAQDRILSAIAEQASPQLSTQVADAFAAARQQAPTGGAVGFIFLVLAAIAIFNQFEYAFDRIWKTATARNEGWRRRIARILLTRLKALSMLIGAGAFVLCATFASVVWAGMQDQLAGYLPITESGQKMIRVSFNLALNLAAFTAMYRFLPRTQVRWSHAVAGGFVAATLWEVGRQVLAVYLLRQNYPTAYGIIGSFLAIMLWAYYATLVVLYGAEFVRVLHDERFAVSSSDMGDATGGP